MTIWKKQNQTYNSGKLQRYIRKYKWFTCSHVATLLPMPQCVVLLTFCSTKLQNWNRQT